MSYRRNPRPTFSIPAALLLPILLLPIVGCAPSGSPPEEVPFVLPGRLIANAEYAARRARLMDEIPDGIGRWYADRDGCVDPPELGEHALGRTVVCS